MTLLHPRVEPTHVNEPDAEALIKEARRLRRRRWGLAALTLALLAGLATGLVVGIRNVPTHRPPPRSALRFEASARPLDGPAVVPGSAWKMAAGPDGSIYIVDQTREEVLRWSPGVGFFDVAGDGRSGFSGDGGPATKASFDFSWASGVTVGRNGTLFIFDTGNGRVRAVSPDGIVTTVVGGGSGSLTGVTGPARGISLGTAPQLGGLTIGPNGELYVDAPNGVYRLDGSVLNRVIGINNQTFRWIGNAISDQTLPVRFDGGTDVAFDGRGDLVVGSDNLYSGYELTTSGARHFLGNMRGDGSVAPLAEGPNGDVAIGTGPDGFEWLLPNGSITQVSDIGAWDERAGISRVIGHRGLFKPSNGIAVSTAGDVFIDTDAGNGWTSVSAIAEVTQSGQVHTVWRS